MNITSPRSGDPSHYLAGMNTCWQLWHGPDGKMAKPALRDQCIYFPENRFPKDLISCDNPVLLQSTMANSLSSAEQIAGVYNQAYVNHMKALVLEMNIGDWVMIKNPLFDLFFIGEIMSEYRYEWRDGLPWHYRKTDWFALNIPSGWVPSVFNFPNAACLREPVQIPTPELEHLHRIFKHRVKRLNYTSN